MEPDDTLPTEDSYSPGGPFTAIYPGTSDPTSGRGIRRYLPTDQQAVRPVVGSPVSYRVHSRKSDAFEWLRGNVVSVATYSFDVLGRADGVTRLANVALDDPWRFEREDFAVVSVAAWVHYLENASFPGKAFFDVQVRDDDYELELVLNYATVKTAKRGYISGGQPLIFDEGLRAAGMLRIEGGWGWPKP